MDFPSITHEMFQAFADERRVWHISESGAGFAAIRREQATSVTEVSEAVKYHTEVCDSREQAAYYIGIRCMQAALVACSLLHEDISNG